MLDSTRGGVSVVDCVTDDCGGGTAVVFVAVDLEV